MTYIVVNRHVIAANKKQDRRDPPISVKRGGTRAYHSEVVFENPRAVRVIYNPDNPLNDATVWIEVEE